MSEAAPKVEWEIFNDPSYYDMVAVRPVGDNDFNSPRLFHFGSREDAETFKVFVEKAVIAVPRQSPPLAFTGIGRKLHCVGCGVLFEAVYTWTGGPNVKGNDISCYRAECICGAKTALIAHAGDEERREYIINAADFSVDPLLWDYEPEWKKSRQE